MKHIMKRGMGKEQGSSSVENIIKDNKNSVKNLIVNHHTNLGGGGEKPPCFVCKRGAALAERKETGETKGWVDIHAHILPGVDDGASDWEEAGEMLNLAHEQGITHIIATPHYISGQDIGRLKELAKQLGEAAHSLSERMTIGLGQEVQYFEELPLFLERGEVLTLSRSRYVLVEFLPGDGYTRLFRAVRSLVQASYLPVIAHAERYGCLRERGRTEELVKCGAYLQMNAGSLGGGIFDRQSVWCRKEIRKGNIHFIATDMHGVLIRPPEMREAAGWMMQQERKGQGAGGMAERLLRQNQEYILRDSVL